jgi:orotidine-5'-phosphate decarboxylase
VPGVGAQGGSAEDAVAGAREDGLGCLINSSRGVLYPSSDAVQAYDNDPRGWVFESAKSHSERFKFDA